MTQHAFAVFNINRSSAFDARTLLTVSNSLVSAHGILDVSHPGLSRGCVCLARASGVCSGTPERGLIHIALPCFCYLGIKHDTKLWVSSADMARPVTVP
jgi:hypothetical protein